MSTVFKQIYSNFCHRSIKSMVEILNLIRLSYTKITAMCRDGFGEEDRDSDLHH